MLEEPGWPVACCLWWWWWLWWGGKNYWTVAPPLPRPQEFALLLWSAVVSATPPFNYNWFKNVRVDGVDDDSIWCCAWCCWPAPAPDPLKLAPKCVCCESSPAIPLLWWLWCVWCSCKMRELIPLLKGLLWGNLPPSPPVLIIVVCSAWLLLYYSCGYPTPFSVELLPFYIEWWWYYWLKCKL